MDALRTMIGLPKADTAALLPRSKVPTLVVMGTKDPDFPDPRVEAVWLADTLGGESLIVDSAGHYPHAELPDEVAPRILAFIEGLGRLTLRRDA